MNTGAKHWETARANKNRYVSQKLGEVERNIEIEQSDIWKVVGGKKSTKSK